MDQPISPVTIETLAPLWIVALDAQDMDTADAIIEQAKNAGLSIKEWDQFVRTQKPDWYTARGTFMLSKATNGHAQSHGEVLGKLLQIPQEKLEALLDENNPYADPLN